MTNRPALASDACVTLIGMPGSGKSTIGRLVARELRFRFTDVDHVIISRTGLRLQQLIERHGREGFLDLEADAIESLSDPGQVIAPGGSIIYRQRAIDHVRRLGPVVFLDLPLSELTLRLGDLDARGVVLPPGTTLADLYAERCPLYAAACTHRLPCHHQRPRETAAAVLALLRGTASHSA